MLTKVTTYPPVLSTFDVPRPFVWVDRPSADEVHVVMTHFKKRIDHYQSSDQGENFEMGQLSKKLDQEPAVKVLPPSDYTRGRLNGIYEGLYWALHQCALVANTLRSDADIHAKADLLRNQIWYNHLQRERERLMGEIPDDWDPILFLLDNMANAIWQKLGEEQMSQQNPFAKGYCDGMYVALAWVLGQHDEPEY